MFSTSLLIVLFNAPFNFKPNAFVDVVIYT